MAIIQRPPKQGGSTTYQGKVAQGYTKILASEADADHDTIFAAWNGGVDAVNIRPDAVTAEKIAPGAVGTRALADGGVTQPKLDPAVRVPPTGAAGGRLTGSYPNPGLAADVEAAVDGTFAGDALKLNPRFLASARAGSIAVSYNDETSTAYYAPHPTWAVVLDGGADDSATVLRRAANAGAWATLMRVGNDGARLATKLDVRANAGLLWHSTTQTIASGATAPLAFDTALANPLPGIISTGTGRFIIPDAAQLALLTFVCRCSTMGGLGVVFTIEGWNGSTWAPRAEAWTTPTNNYVNMVGMSRGDLQYRVMAANASGGVLSILASSATPMFGCAIVGRHTA